MEKSNVKKGAGIISLVLGLFAWLGDKYAWFSAKVTETLNVLSLAFGAVTTFA